MKKNKTMRSLFILFSFFSPYALQAQTGDFTFFETFLSGVRGVLASLIPILIGIALIIFIWGLVLFITKSGDEKSHEEGRQKMVWGIITLFVMVSVWGIVSLLGTILDVGGAASAPPPDVLY